MARGDGTTSRQMENAPYGALFVWPNEVLDYPRALANHLGRGDLEIVGPSALKYYEQRLAGRQFSGVVLDHATGESLTLREWDGYHVALSLVRRVADEGEKKTLLNPACAWPFPERKKP